MEDIKTATVALRALVELGYPLELSRVIDYLATSPDSKDELIHFDNEEALYSFLDKFPSMFWVDGSKVFPAQVKPKAVSRCSNTIQLPQSHSVVQLATDGSDDRRQEDQPMGEVEEQDEYKNGAPKGNTEMSCSGEKKEVKLTDSKVVRLHTEDKGDKEGNPSKEEVNSKKNGKVRDDKEENDKRAKDDTQENVNMETLQKQAALYFIEVLRAKGPVPLKRVHGYASSCPVQVRKAIPGGPVKIRELFLKYPNIFTVDTDDIVHLQPSHTAELKDDDKYMCISTSVASTGSDTVKASNVNHGKVRQEEDKSILTLKCSTKQKTEDVLNDATTVPSTSTLCTSHAQEPQESQHQFPIGEATKESAYMTVIRNLFTEQKKVSIVTIVEKLRAVFSEDKIGEVGARLFIKRHPDTYQMTEDDIVVEQAPVNVMGTISKVGKLCALATLEDGSQVYIPKALYAERVGVDCASIKDHLSKGDCILMDTEPGRNGRTGKWAATNIRAIFKSPNIHISNDGAKKIDLHTAVPHLLATKVKRSPSELDDVILHFVITFFNKRTELTLQDLQHGMRYLNHDALRHLRSSGGLLKFLQEHPDKFQIVHTHAVSVNKEHSQSCINTSNLDAKCAIGEESSTCISAMETATMGTPHQGDKTSSSHSGLPSNPDNEASSESIVTVRKIVNAYNIHAHTDSATCTTAAKCIIGEIQSLKDDVILFYLQNGEKALLSGLKKLQKDTAKNVECLSVGDCVLLDVVPGPHHGGTQWIVSKVRHTLKKAVPPQIQCSESTAAHGNEAHKGVLQHCMLEEELNTVLAWFTFLGNKVRVSFEDLEAGMRDLPKNVQKCTLQKAGPIQFLQQYPSLFHVDNVMSEVCLSQYPHTSTTCYGGMLVPESSSVQDKEDAPVQPRAPIEGSIVAGHVIEAGSSEPSVAALDQAAMEFFRNKVSEKGKVSIHELSSCFGACPMAIRKHVHSSEKGLIAFFKDHAETFSLKNEKVVSLMDISASAMEEAKPNKTAKETAAMLSGDRRTTDMNIIDVATPSPTSSSSEDCDVIECNVLSGNQEVDTLLEEGVAHFVEVLKKKGSMPLSRIHGHVNQLREEVKKAIGGGQEKVRALFLKFPAYFFIDAADSVHLAPKQQEEKEASKQREGDMKAEAALLEEGAAHFVAVLEKKGSMPLSRINGHVCQCREEVKQAIGGGPEKVRTLFLKFPAYFYVDAADTVHLTSRPREDGMKSEAALLEEGAAHFVQVLEKKGNIPLSRIHGHMYACRKEVWKAIGGGPENARSLFLKFPGYFHIDSEENVCLTSTITQECINAVSAALERKGPIHLGELVSHVSCCKPQISSFFERNSLKTFLEQHPMVFVIDAYDNMVYLVSVIKEEGVKYFKGVLELKGSLHIKNLCGHSSKYKYLAPMLKVIGGSQSSVMDFLKGFPEVFSIDDDEVVHLTSATTPQSQGNRSYAMVVQTGQKIQTNAPDKSHLQENRLGESKSASSTAVAGKANKESILFEGVQHFKQVLESKGSMPVQNIYGHINQCRNEVKWAIGSSVDKVKTFLLRYPEVFHIDKKLTVHLVCNRANEQQQEQHKTNIGQLQIEQKALAHFKGMLFRKGPSTTHVLSSCFSTCDKDISMHVGNSKEGLTKFFMKHPQIFKVDANKVVYLKGTSSSKSGSCSPLIQSKVGKPQRWASCDTLAAVPRGTVFPKLQSKLSGSTPDVRSTVCGGRLQQAEEVHDKHSQQPQEDCKDNNRTGNGASTCKSVPHLEKQHTCTSDQKANSNNVSDKFVTAVKDILSEKGCLHLVQLVKELGTMLPHERFESIGVKLFLKKCPDDFHVNNQDMVEERPPINVLAMVNNVSSKVCFATLEDGSKVFVYIALYRERMGVDCTRLQDHLSPGDILLVDTERGKSGSSMKWAATKIRAVFKFSKSVDADKNGVNLQTPMPFLPATTITRSPSEICGAIVKLVASFLKVTSPLQVKDLITRMKYLNHDAVLYLREKGGLLSFLQSQPQMFQVQDECVTLIAGEGELDEGTSQCLAAPGAKCTIGKVSMIAKNIAHLHLPDDKKAILDLTDAHNSTATSCLSVGDCVVAYVVPSHDQSEIPWVVSKVKHIMGKAVPAQIHAKIATATHGSHHLKEVLQQCVLETEVDTVLAWHKVLSKKLKMSFESLAGSFDKLPKEVKNYTSQTGGPCKILEKYPTLFHIDNVRSTVCLVECSPMDRAVFFGGAKPMLSGPVKVEGNAQPVTEKAPSGLENSLASAADTDKEAVEFFRGKVLEKGQVSVQVLSTCFGACPMAIRHHVGSSVKGLAKFLRDHPNTFSLDENDMVCTLKDTLKTVKQEREMDHIAQKATAYLKAILSENGPSTIHVLSSGFGLCDADIRMHVGSSEIGLTNFFMEHPEIFTVDANQVVSLTGKTSAKVGPSFPPNKDGGGDKLDSNCSSVARLVDAQEHLKHPAPIQAVEENTNDVSNQKQTSELAKRVSDESSLDYHIGSALLQEGNKLSSNVQEDRDISSVEDASRSSCHQSPNPPVSPCSQVQHIEDKADQENNQQEPEQMLDQAEIEKETLELIVNLVWKCEQVSLRSLQGHINLLGEEKQDCIKNKGGLVAFLQHHYGQIFKIDPTSENVSLKGIQDVQEAGPDFLTSSAKGEQLQPTQLTVEGEVEKAGYSLEKASIHVDICDAENNKNHDVPITEAGDDTGTSSLRLRHKTEACEDVDISTVVTPPALVAHEADIVSPISPVQTQGPLPEQYLNQEEAICDSSGLPTATVHPMTLPSVNSNVPNADGGRLTQGTSDGVCTERGSAVELDTEAVAGVVNMHSTQAKVTATPHDDLTTSSRCHVALQTVVQTEDVRNEPHVSHASTIENTDALSPSSADISLAPSQSLQGIMDTAWAESKPSLGQQRPLHLLVGEDGARVWANPGKQDMQPFAAVCPTETVVPVANPPGQPDDFTSLLPMFKDNLSPIQDNLVEVEMDIGRIPIARYYNPGGPCLLAPLRLSEQPLTRETLETILSALPLERSAIGQGRVLLRGSLHWVSTLKNSSGQVVGLTLRRGQAVPDCLDLLWDMVTSGISTLIVGRPCSGKTTLLREWARVLSDFCYRRVIVVDTLNEIAGGDDVPHPGVGGARRVQVHNRWQQVSQLQAAARNHSPDCIIVDEVQTQEEVTALQAIRLTGIQVVAGVCAGCLTDLLHNSVMRGLLGLSDPPSSTSASQGVSQQPPTFPQTLPVFQAAVQIHNRDNLSVYSDVASFVRMSLLEGRFPVAQHRKRVVTKDRETEL